MDFIFTSLDCLIIFSLIYIKIYLLYILIYNIYKRGKDEPILYKRED